MYSYVDLLKTHVYVSINIPLQIFGTGLPSQEEIFAFLFFEGIIQNAIFGQF